MRFLVSSRLLCWNIGRKAAKIQEVRFAVFVSLESIVLSDHKVCQLIRERRPKKELSRSVTARNLYRAQKALRENLEVLYCTNFTFAVFVTVRICFTWFCWFYQFV